MKHLRSYSQKSESLKDYKAFESVDSIDDILNDICLELNDDGFSGRGKPVMVEDTDGLGDKYSVILMTKNKFYFDEIKDTIYRIKDVLGDKLQSFTYKKYKTDRYTIGDINQLKNETIENIRMCGLFITFKK